MPCLLRHEFYRFSVRKYAHTKRAVMWTERSLELPSAAKLFAFRFEQVGSPLCEYPTG